MENDLVRLLLEQLDLAKTEIEGMKQEIKVKDQILEVKEQEIEGMKQEIEVKGQILEVKEQEIEGMKQEIEVKDQILEVKEQEIEGMKQEIEVKQQQNYELSLKKLFTDGLPSMIKEQSTTNAQASRSHSPATVDLNFAKIFPNGIQTNYQDGHSNLLEECARLKIRYCSESDVQLNVRYVLSDMIAAGGFSGRIKLSNELTVKELRPDIWVIHTRDHYPIGVIEIKKPTEDILKVPGVLGQLFDYMLRLHCFHKLDRVIGILSTYDEWRICELDFDRINERKMFATDIYTYKNPETLHVLISTLSTMVGTTKTQLPLMDNTRPYLFVTEEEIFQWRYLKQLKSQLSCLMPQFVSFSGLYLIRDYHSGGDGRVWLGCSREGNLAVVKFLHNQSNPIDYLQRVQSEVLVWNTLFGENTAYIKILFGATAIVMPFVFHCINNDNTWCFANSLSKWNSTSEDIGAEPMLKENVNDLLYSFTNIRTTAIMAINLFAQHKLIHQDLELRHLGLLPVFQAGILQLVPTFIDLSRVEFHDNSDQCREKMLSKLNDILGDGNERK